MLTFSMIDKHYQNVQNEDVNASSKFIRKLEENQLNPNCPKYNVKWKNNLNLEKLMSKFIV